MTEPHAHVYRSDGVGWLPCPYCGRTMATTLAAASPNYHPGQYTSPRTEPFVLGHITWPDGNLRIVQEELS